MHDLISFCSIATPYNTILLPIAMANGWNLHSKL